MAPARLSLCFGGLACSLDTRGREGLRVPCGLWLLRVAPGEVRTVRASRCWVQEKDASPGTRDRLPHMPPVGAMHWAGDTPVPSRLLHAGSRAAVILQCWRPG